MRLAACLIFLPSLLHAQDFNDYARIFSDNAAAVVVRTDDSGQKVATLNLPGPVVLQRFGVVGGYHYSGTDHSDGGAVGCVFMIVSELADIAAHCDVPITKDQKANLDGVLADVAGFVAVNSVPPLTLDEVMQRLASTSRYNEPGACEQAQGGDVTAMIAAFSDDGARARFAKALSVPRLPVGNPCF